MRFLDWTWSRVCHSEMRRDSKWRPPLKSSSPTTSTETLNQAQFYPSYCKSPPIRVENSKTSEIYALPIIKKMDISSSSSNHNNNIDSNHNYSRNNHSHNHHHICITNLPPIECSAKQCRSKPLTVEEYEYSLRHSASDLELIERVFCGSMSCNQLRAALWPYLFGLVEKRGKFEKIKHPDGGEAHNFVEHEGNKNRWLDLEKLYYLYQAQWKAISPDQETRFSTYHERKSLIERDVIRCDRMHPFYAEQPHNLATLTNLLMTYMMYDFDIGYVQGMSDLAGPILYMFEGDLIKAFWVFVEVMKLFRRNFEFTQKTIHFQLGCLYELIKNTDPVFARYLEKHDSSNCFFAFRAIVCQFKRELMKEDEDYYNKVLFLWDTIWCAKRRVAMQSNGCKQDELIGVVDSNQSDTPRHKLTETEIFVLALCLSMIRRERDQILADRLDSTEINLHFIDPKLSSDLNAFIEHGMNIYSYMKNDFDVTKLSSPKDQKTANPDSLLSTEGYDLLQDFLIINGSPC